MKTLLYSAAMATLMTALSLSSSVRVQAQTTPPAASTVVVDINYLFKNHPNFKRQMDQMKGEVDAFEAQMRQMQQELGNLQEQLGLYRVGTTEYQEVEQQMARLAADMQVQTQVKKREFQIREAHIYHETYQEISGIIGQFAQQRGITLVLRFSSDQVDPNNPDDVLRGVNRAVVWQQNLNITYDVLNIINQQHASQPGQPTR